MRRYRPECAARGLTLKRESLINSVHPMLSMPFVACRKSGSNFRFAGEPLVIFAWDSSSEDSLSSVEWRWSPDHGWLHVPRTPSVTERHLPWVHGLCGSWNKISLCRCPLEHHTSGRRHPPQFPLAKKRDPGPRNCSKHRSPKQLGMRTEIKLSNNFP